MSEYFCSDIWLATKRTHILHKFNHKGFDISAHFLFFETELINELDVVETFEVFLNNDYGEE
jgi:hypothetical protein